MEIRWFRKKNENEIDNKVTLSEIMSKRIKSFKKLDSLWFNYLSYNTPCGKVLRNNTYTDFFLSDTIRMVHVTPAIKKIKKSKKILPSGGGLGAAIYCVPVYPNLNPHNLFHQFYNFQLPKKYKNLSLIYFEINLSKREKNLPYSWGVDYTDFGKIHCKVWKKIKKCIPCEDNNLIERKILKKIIDIKNIFNIFIEKDINTLNREEFKKNWGLIFNNFPSLRFMLFEILTEFILLYQEDIESEKYTKKGELYNLNHKKIVYNLCPEMFKKFRIVSFNIKFDSILEEIKRSEIMSHFDEPKVFNFFKGRLAYYIKKLCKKKLSSFSSFDSLIEKHPDLIGQIIYRSYNNKKLFERYRTPLIYREIFRKKLFCPIYSIIPKGEIGLNPNIPLNKIKIFEAIYDKRSDKIIPKKKLDITFSNRLVEDNLCTIR